MWIRNSIHYIYVIQLWQYESFLRVRLLEYFSEIILEAFIHRGYNGASVILIGQSHSTNADHDRLIRSRKYETKQFIANWIMTSIIHWEI